MKKIIAFILLLAQFSCTKPPKDTLQFKVQYQAEKTYNTKLVRTSHTIVKYKGTNKMLQKLEAKGLSNPTISIKKSEADCVLKTGKMPDIDELPATVQFKLTLSDDGKKDHPLDAVFNGYFSSDNLPVFNDVNADRLNEEEKTICINSMENLFTQLSFSERTVKIGDDFIIESTSSIPMEGSTLDMKITTTYKLNSISNNLAKFDISQQYVLQPRLMDNSLHGSVTGKGQMVYDIANSIVANYTLDTEMNLTKKLDSFEFEMKTIGTNVQTTKVSGN